MPRIYPEWFVGGPWHGRRKDTDFPYLTDRVHAAMVPRFNIRELLGRQQPDVTQMRDVPTYTYVPKMLDIFGERITVWVGEGDASLAGPEMPEWLQMVGQLIMSPHRCDENRTPANTDVISRRHQDLWETERRIRRQVEREYEERLLNLRAENNRLIAQSNSRQAPGGNWILEDKPKTARFEFNDGEDDYVARMMENVVLYFDQGDGTAEYPPAWVATAQHDGIHEGPFMGYGTSKRAAILALMADTLQIFAGLDRPAEGEHPRMVQTGERFK